MNAETQPLLLFFCSRLSGPSRRMDSLIAHLARKERARVRVARVDVDERPDLADRLGVSSVPTLVLIKARTVAARLDGRASAPQIDAMLQENLPAAA